MLPASAVRSVTRPSRSTSPRRSRPRLTDPPRARARWGRSRFISVRIISPRRILNPPRRDYAWVTQGDVMVLSSHFDPRTSRKVVGVAASAALHLALLLIIMFGGSQYGIDSGDVPTSKLVLLEAPDAEQREGEDLPPLPAGSTAPSDVELEDALARVSPPANDAIADQAVEPGPIDAVEAPAASPLAIVESESPTATVPM